MALPTAARVTQDLICVRAAQPRSLRGWRAWKQIVKRMVLSTIHVSQAHILEKQSRRRTADSTVRPYGWIQESTVRLFLYRFAATSGRKLIDDWVWHENPSSEIARTLSSLCGEVPYLGEACSVVELRTHEDYGFPVDAGKYVWTLSTDSALTSIFKKGKVFSFPKKGRLEDLKQAFAAANPAPKGKKKAPIVRD